MCLSLQETTTSSVEFQEESGSLLIAPEFSLRDYDSPDSLITSLTITLTLTHAIDGDSEGVIVSATGGMVYTEQVTTEEFTKEYTLTNGTSYSQYEEVHIH